MIAYWNALRTVYPATRLHASHRGALLELGELEAGTLDALENEPDITVELAFSNAMRSLAQSYLGLPTHQSPPNVLCRLAQLPLPPKVSVSTPEGFAYYCLFPETYAEAARQFFNEHKPQAVIVIGLRSIGTTLSAIVAAQLEHAGCRVWRTTVRPIGHPFDRYVKLPAATQQAIRQWPHSWFAIIDEGPGLSGSSFAGTIKALLDAEVQEERIVLFPSWDPAPDSFRSEAARRHWPRHKRYIAPFDRSKHLPWLPESAVEISAGAWRDQLLGHRAWPAIHPQHERRKYIFQEGGRRVVAKFSGLGHYGQPAHDLALQLAEHRLTPPVRAFSDGFLLTEFVDGQHLPAQCTAALLDHLAEYLAFRATLPNTAPSASFDELKEMITVNCTEAGMHPPVVDHLQSAVEASEPIAVDGRMLPYEWLQTATGYCKTDAVDHHRDHFFAGAQDVAWDLAGTSVEFQLPIESLADRYMRLRRDPDLPHRLPFYVVAYLAFRLGYVTLASQSTGEADSERFNRLAQNYSGQLGRVIAEIHT